MTDISIDEKRVYEDRTGGTELLVASELGVTAVTVSDDLIGEFSLVEQCAARDVAAGEDEVAVATGEDVLVGAGGEFSGTGFGPAVAVTVAEDWLVAAGPDGAVGRRDDGEWSTLGTVADVRAIEGDLVATADGVYRLDGDDLTHVGLDDVADVATDGTPLAATGDGLYYLGPGWARAQKGAFTTVGTAGERAHAATPETLYERHEGEWRERSVPVDEPIVEVAYGRGVYAVTETGTVLVDVGDGWRTRSLGLPGVAGLVVSS